MSFKLKLHINAPGHLAFKVSKNEYKIEVKQLTNVSRKKKNWTHDPTPCSLTAPL